MPPVKKKRTLLTSGAEKHLQSRGMPVAVEEGVMVEVPLPVAVGVGVLVGTTVRVLDMVPAGVLFHSPMKGTGPILRLGAGSRWLDNRL